MQAVSKGPNIDKSALLIVDMQNDFLHRDGSFKPYRSGTSRSENRHAVSDRDHP